MKRVPFTIESMEKAREALNIALSQALSMISQNGVMEAKVGIVFNIEMRPDAETDGWLPIIKYRTSVQVPMKIDNGGTITNATHVYWDRDQGGYVMELSGEQMRLEGI